jgi:hypothetical protein
MRKSQCVIRGENQWRKNVYKKLTLLLRQRPGTVGLFGAEGIHFPFCTFRFILANLASVGNLFSPLTTLNPHTHTRYFLYTPSWSFMWLFDCTSLYYLYFFEFFHILCTFLVFKVVWICCNWRNKNKLKLKFRTENLRSWGVKSILGWFAGSREYPCSIAMPRFPWRPLWR